MALRTDARTCLPSPGAAALVVAAALTLGVSGLASAAPTAPDPTDPVDPGPLPVVCPDLGEGGVGVALVDATLEAPSVVGGTASARVALAAGVLLPEGCDVPVGLSSWAADAPTTDGAVPEAVLLDVDRGVLDPAGNVLELAVLTACPGPVVLWLGEVEPTDPPAPGDPRELARLAADPTCGSAPEPTPTPVLTPDPGSVPTPTPTTPAPTPTPTPTEDSPVAPLPPTPAVVPPATPARPPAPARPPVVPSVAGPAETTSTPVPDARRTAPATRVPAGPAVVLPVVAAPTPEDPLVPRPAPPSAAPVDPITTPDPVGTPTPTRAAGSEDASTGVSAPGSTEAAASPDGLGRLGWTALLAGGLALAATGAVVALARGGRGRHTF